MSYISCVKCHTLLKIYFIGKDGMCNGCRNPHLIVESIPHLEKDQCDRYETGKQCDLDDCIECCPHDELDHGNCLACGHDLNGILDAIDVIRRDRS